MAIEILTFLNDNGDYDFAYIDDQKKLQTFQAMVYCATCNIWYDRNEEGCTFCSYTNQKRGA